MANQLQEAVGKAGAPKAEELDEKEAKDEANISLRELFWDKLIFFFSNAIVALTVVDILTELLRGGSGVVCFVDDAFNLTDGQEAYVSGYCAQSVPDTQYFPIFVLVHGVTIGVCHYLWRSSVADHLDYFFTMVKSCDRFRDHKTGEYPLKNLLIIRKLSAEFCTYNRSSILWWYRIKLFVQLLVCIASILLAFLVFTDFDVNFFCPRNGTEDQYWPIPGVQIECLFASLRLFFLVRVFDVLLLSVIIFACSWGLVWSVWRHTTELNTRNISLFSFTTGISPDYFIPKRPFNDLRGFCRECCISPKRFVREIAARIFQPMISSDLDFLLMVLYRTDSSLGHVIKEGQIHSAVEYLRNGDQQVLRVSRDVMRDDDDLKKEKEDPKIALKWNFPLGKDNYSRFQPVDCATPLELPDVIRGAVVAFALRAPTNEFAIDVSFGTLGFALALTRVFKEVVAFSFDPLYRDTEKPVLLTTASVNVRWFRCNEDVFYQKGTSHTAFGDNVKEIWEKGSHLKTGLVVIGPITQRIQMNTVETLLDKMDGHLADEAILLCVYPFKIEGNDTTQQFHRYTPPPKWYEPLKHNVAEDTHSEFQQWPGVTTASSTTGAPPASANLSEPRNNTFILECGNSSCKFELRAYKRIRPEEPNQHAADPLPQPDTDDDDSDENPALTAGGDSRELTLERGSPALKSKSTKRDTGRVKKDTNKSSDRHSNKDNDVAVDIEDQLV